MCSPSGRDIARTAGILAALLFALPFGFGRMRSASLSARTTLSDGALGDWYFISAAAGRERGAGVQPDPVILSGVPTAALALAAAVMLWRVR